MALPVVATHVREGHFGSALVGLGSAQVLVSIDGELCQLAEGTSFAAHDEVPERISVHTQDLPANFVLSERERDAEATTAPILPPSVEAKCLLLRSPSTSSSASTTTPGLNNYEEASVVPAPLIISERTLRKNWRSICAASERTRVCGGLSNAAPSSFSSSLTEKMEHCLRDARCFKTSQLTLRTDAVSGQPTAWWSLKVEIAVLKCDWNSFLDGSLVDCCFLAVSSALASAKIPARVGTVEELGLLEDGDDKKNSETSALVAAAGASTRLFAERGPGAKARFLDNLNVPIHATRVVSVSELAELSTAAFVSATEPLPFIETCFLLPTRSGMISGKKEYPALFSRASGKWPETKSSRAALQQIVGVLRERAEGMWKGVENQIEAGVAAKKDEDKNMSTGGTSSEEDSDED